MPKSSIPVPQEWTERDKPVCSDSVWVPLARLRGVGLGPLPSHSGDSSLQHLASHLGILEQRAPQQERKVESHQAAPQQPSSLPLPAGETEARAGSELEEQAAGTPEAPRPPCRSPRRAHMSARARWPQPASAWSPRLRAARGLRSHPRHPGPRALGPPGRAQRPARPLPGTLGAQPRTPGAQRPARPALQPAAGG